MFGLFKRKRKSDPILDELRKENERLDKILVEKQKETAKVEEEILIKPIKMPWKRF